MDEDDRGSKLDSSESPFDALRTKSLIYTQRELDFGIKIEIAKLLMTDKSAASGVRSISFTKEALDRIAETYIESQEKVQND